MDWLTNIKSFIDVVNYHSFTKAAEKCYSSPAVLSRRVAWLEDRLGAVLMQRTTRSLQLTEEGKQFYTKGKQWLADLNEITLHVQDQQQTLKGSLQITMPYSFAESPLVSQLLAEFSLKNPNIELILDFSNQVYDLIERDIDIAFRASPYEKNDYTSVKITSYKLGIYASPGYVAKYGMPKTLNELAQHNCLLHQQMGYSEWEFQNGKKVLVSGNLKSNATFALIHFAKQGLGLVRTLDCYVASHVAKRALQPVLESKWSNMDLYLVYKNQAMRPRRISLFVEFIKKYDIKKYLTL